MNTKLTIYSDSEDRSLLWELYLAAKLEPYPECCWMMKVPWSPAKYEDGLGLRRPTLQAIQEHGLF